MKIVFQDEAQESAEAYYKLVTEKCDGGKVIYNAKAIVKVDDKTGRNYWLTLDKRVKSIDGLRVLVIGKEESETGIEPLQLSHDKYKVKVRLHKGFEGVFNDVDADKIKVIVDLSFLITRVKEWYKQFGGRIECPTSMPLIRFQRQYGDIQLSADQKTAIHGIFETPYSYVWGAPGTGKTKCVLSQAVLSYVAAGKKVLVVAPTNNAVEQTLYGLLEQMKTAGFNPDEHVIRLGLANPEFQREYPDVCENLDITHKLQYLETEIEDIDIQLNDCEEEKARWAQLEIDEKNLALITEKEEESGLLFIELTNSFERLKGTQSNKNAEVKQLDEFKSELAELINTIDYLKMESGELLKRQSSMIQRAAAVIRGRNLKKELDTALVNRRHYEAQKLNLEDRIQQKETAIQQYEAVIKREKSTIERVIGKLREVFSSNSTINSILSNTDESNYQIRIKDIEAEIHSTIDILEKLISAQKSAKPLAVIEENIRSLMEERKRIEEAISEMNEGATSKRIEKCSIIAATIDACLGRLPPNDEIRFQHVFLDEACYCSLIKAVSLTAYHCPLTFLGDHMQLNPVCEANEGDMLKNKSLCLWAQSALYTETVFDKPIEEIYNMFINNKEWFSEKMKIKTFTLYHTYRFGETLAKVLAGFAYDSRFTGASDRATNVYYINVRRRAGEQGRKNIAEIDAIDELLTRRPSLRGEKATGIITPYRLQRGSLSKRIEKHFSYAEDNIVTVHGSQGREWNTVIFSVTDTTDKWFTDSNNQIAHGKQLINTAISRAKESLIIVCDYDYWITQKTQLLQRLLLVATELKL